MTPDFDTYLMDAYDRWCEDHYDTEGEYDEDSDYYPAEDAGMEAGLFGDC